MKILSLLSLSLFLLGAALSAKVITVDNNVGSVAMYDNIQDAYTDAEDDDTILIAGSATSYGTLDCYKVLHFVGNGYWLPDTVNDIPGTNRHSTVLWINFKENVGLGLGDSSGSSATGLHTRINTDATVSGIVVDKCVNTANDWWTFNGPATVTRSYVRTRGIRLNASNSSVSNSRIANLVLDAEDTSANFCTIPGSIDTVINSSVSNCVFLFESAGNLGADGNFTYCINVGPADIVPAGIGNDTDAHLLADVIADPLADDGVDNYYILKEGSPASGTGQDGEDMGMFGGSTPYVLSGVPGIPRMTAFSVPAIATGLTVLEFELSAQAFPE